MTRYSYRAIDDGGGAVSGSMRAASTATVRAALRERRLEPVELVAKRSLLQFEITRKRVPRDEIMHFSRQLGVFLRAGIPILDALAIITEETTNQLLKRALEDIISSLGAGETFAAAVAAHPEAYPPYCVGILVSAELSGSLDTVLDRLADYIERDGEARSRLLAALMYPAIVFCLAIVVVVVLTVFVLPRFETFFTSLHATLPLPTRMLLSFTGFISHSGAILGGVVLALVIAGVLVLRSPRARGHLDAIVLHVPIAGDLIRHAVIERVCRVLAGMVGAGVPLPDAMRVAGDATNNAVYRRGLEAVREAMMKGQGLAAPLAETGLFPATIRQMVHVGEATGGLDAQLETAATYYGRELEAKLKHFTSLFEPAIIIFIGAVVGFVAVALVSAMYGIYRQVKVT